MIKVKNLENVRDDESIQLSKVTSLVPEKLISSKRSIKKSGFLSKKNMPFCLQYTPEQSEGSSLNSSNSLTPQKALDFRNPDTISYNEYMQKNKRKKYRQNGNQLRKIISKQKIQLLVQNFIHKLSRNNIYSKPVEYSPFHNDMEINFMDNEGIEPHDYFSIGVAMLSVFQIIILSIIYTLSIVFDQVNKDSTVQAFQTFSLVFYLIEIGINFVTVKFEEGKRLGTLREIWRFYLKDNFMIDLISMVILMLDLFANFRATIYFRLFIIVKLNQGLQKVQKLEIFFINNFYNEQYWNLIKVFLFNFSFAHILAIFLIAMAAINDQENWMNYKDIYLAPWFQKYAWAYYWATTMMLTVGFGDLAATTYQEAMILTLVEMISCICLAYNINCVGTLISNIRSQDVQKSKNFKIFRKLAKRNDVSQDLEWRINNYIEESSNIRKKFNHEEENIFVEKLPKDLKTQFLKESNKKIFHNLPFFKNLMERTLFSFAQKIEMRICHPEEIIQHIDDPHHLFILKSGEVGFTCKKIGCDYNYTIIDRLGVVNVAEPILISLGFIRQSRSIYEIKSLEYSILYFLDNETIMSILKCSEMDYELYCLLKDKCSHIPDEYELFKCEICKGQHTKFSCPKLHYLPIRQHVANKYLNKYMKGKVKRNNDFARYEPQQFCALKIFTEINQDQTKKTGIFKKEKQETKLSDNFLNQRKKFERIEEPSTSIIKELSDMKDFFSRNAAELIKHEMNKVLKQGQGYDEVWIVDSDRMKNYKNYFEADNSCNLQDKFSIDKRLGTDDEVEDYWSDHISKHSISNHSAKGHERTEQTKKTFKTSLKSIKTLKTLKNLKNLALNAERKRRRTQRK